MSQLSNINNDTFFNDVEDAKLKHELIAFLNRSQLWPSVEVAVNAFIKDLNERGEDFRLSPILLSMLFDMSRIKDEHFLQFLATESYAFGRLLNQTLHVVITKCLHKFSANVSIQLEQIHVKAQCKNLPRGAPYNLMAGNNLMRKGLANFTGILTGYSDLKKSIRHSVWYCPNQCPVNVITGLVTKPIRCAECTTELMEYSKYRHMSDYMSLDMLPIDAVRGTSSQQTIYRSLRLRVNGELTQMHYTLGHEYHVSGLYDGHTQEFIVWDIELIE